MIIRSPEPEVKILVDRDHIKTSFEEWARPGHFSRTIAKGPETTTWIWNLHADAHDFDSHTSDLEEISRKVFSAHFGQLSIIFLWLSGMYFHGARFSNYEAWLSDPTHIRPSAQVVWPIVGQEILNGDVGGGFRGIQITSGFFQIWRASGITSELQLYCTAIGGLVFAALMLFAGWFHYHKAAPKLAWFQDVESMLNHHLAGLLGLGSLSWAGHQVHVSLPINQFLNAGVDPKEIPLPHEFILNRDLLAQLYPSFAEGATPFFTLNWSKYSDFLTFRGGLDPVTGGLWLTDTAHHHLAIAILFLIAGHMYRTNWGIGHGLKDILEAHKGPFTGQGHKGLYEILTTSWHAQLSLNLAMLGSLTIIVAHHMYAMPPYPYLATDYGTQLSLFTHHMWIGGFLIVGAAAHAAIFMVRDYDPTTRYNDLLDRVLRHRDAIISHLNWACIFLGFHSFGLYIHNDTMSALGRPQDMFSDTAIQLQPVFAQWIQNTHALAPSATAPGATASTSLTWGGGDLVAVGGKVALLPIPLGTADFLVHHIHAFTIHVTVLILLKGVLFARSSRLIPDKANLGFRFPCDGPGRGGTCQVSAWDHVFLGLFWMYNAISVVIFHFSWKMQSDVWGSISDQGVVTHITGGNFAQSSITINGWLRDFLWAQASQEDLKGIMALRFPRFSQGLAQDPTTRRIWFGIATAHDFESHDDITEERLYQNIFASHFGQLAIIFLWTSGNLFHVAWQGNFESWVQDPLHVRPIAHAIWDPHFGQPAVEAFTRGGALGPVNIAYSGVYQWWYTIGLRTNEDLYTGALFLLFISAISLIAGWLHLQPKWKPSVSWFKNAESRLNHHLSGLFGVSSLAWTGHLVHVAIPASRGEYVRWNNFLDVLPHPQGLGPLFTGQWNLYAQNPDSSSHLFGTSQGAGTAILTLLGGFHPQTQSLWLTDMAHHHLAIAFIFLIAGHMYRTNFGIGHSMKDLLDAHIPPGGRLGRGHKGLYDTINNSLHFQLGLALASLGVITSLVAQHMYSLPAYAFIAQDFTTQAALYTHHQYIAGFIMTGAFAHGAIFFIRDYNPEQNEDNVLARMLEHKEAIISHLSWASLFLGFHTLGLYVHNDVMLAFGPGDFLVHHAIALGLHTTTLILVKGALDARGSKLMPDKKDFGYSFPCDGPGRGGTCDISAWDAFYLAVFWMLNTIGWVTFYWHWKHITLWQGNVSQFNESSTYLMGWLRDYLWLNSSQLINGYNPFGMNSLSVWAWMFLFGHLVWATGFMFLISWRGYWQELIETLAWAHERTPLANLIRWRDKPVALSIVQARLVGLAHFSVGYIFTYAAFLIASTSGKFG
ncbi:photosystem I P700 apoprotein A1 [Tanacetum coccineum]